jgi:hypothetical protein
MDDSEPILRIFAGVRGYEATFVSPDALASAIRDELRRSTSPIVVAAMRESLDDEVLRTYVDALTAGMASRVPFADLPRVTFLTARNRGALTWLIAKSLAFRPTKRPSFAAFGVDDGIVMSKQVGARRFRDRSIRTAAELATQLGERRALVSYETHGGDACAHGGHGVVLCGLAEDRSELDLQADGVLACGHGLPCPRGPFPFPLSRAGADVLLLASCRSVRLAGSAMAPEFNLSLSHLEGRGVATIGAYMCGIGTNFPARAIIAALSNGWSLSDAVTFGNAFSLRSGLDHPALIAIGEPDLRISLEPLADFAEKQITAPEIVAQAHAGNLRARTLAGDAPVLYTSILEGDGSVRLFSFRFPRVGISAEVEPAHCEPAEAVVAATISSAEAWLDLWRHSRLRARRAELADRAEELVEARAALIACIRRALLDTSAANDLAVLEREVGSLRQYLREQVVESFVHELNGSFWLTNQLTAEYAFVSGSTRACTNCSRPALSRVLRHVLRGSERTVLDCPRCGFVLDTRIGGSIASARVLCADHVRAGELLSATIEVEGPAGEASVHPRLCTDGGPEVKPADGAPSIRLDGRATRRDFELRIPADLAPHYYFLKILVDTSDDIAFVSRLVYVLPA